MVWFSEHLGFNSLIINNLGFVKFYPKAKPFQPFATLVLKKLELGVFLSQVIITKMLVLRELVLEVLVLRRFILVVFTSKLVTSRMVVSAIVLLEMLVSKILVPSNT